MTTLNRVILEIFSNPWLVSTIVGVLLPGLAEAGYRYGLRLYRIRDERRRTQIRGAQAEILGLLALLLGFTFAMAIERDATRRELIIKEANSIRTTYLRAALLPAPHRQAIEDLMSRYINVRIDFHNAGLDEERIARDEKEARDIRKVIWKHAVASVNETSKPTVTPFLTSLNETMDFDSARLAALHGRVPGVVWLLLLVVASLGCWSSGYGSGACGKRTFFPTIGLPLIIALVILVVADIDRPHRGFIGFSQESLLDVKAELQNPDNLRDSIEHSKE